MRLCRGFAIGNVLTTREYRQQDKDAQSTVRECLVRDVMLQNDWCVAQGRSHKLVIHWVRLIRTCMQQDDQNRRTCRAINSPCEHLVILTHEDGGAERDQELPQSAKGPCLRSTHERDNSRSANAH